jgi:chromosomal replication initiator protein
MSLCPKSARYWGDAITTVLYACEKVADMIERDDHLRRRISQVREALYGRSVAA